MKTNNKKKILIEILKAFGMPSITIVGDGKDDIKHIKIQDMWISHK